MNDTLRQKLEAFVVKGTTISSAYNYKLWASQVLAFLTIALGQDEATRFSKLAKNTEWSYDLAMQRGHLEGLIITAETPTFVQQPLDSTTVLPPPVPSSVVPDGRKVFIVHGHDDAAKESTARFLDRLGLEPIILHEQASSGRTVIEKFEIYSGDVVFAVVLLTPDDVGSVAGKSSDLKKRARQNVIMELGYFIGRLGRTRVCALYKGDVELPSDYQGVLYIEMDSAGAWKGKLAQELVQSKITIELTGLLGA